MQDTEQANAAIKGDTEIDRQEKKIEKYMLETLITIAARSKGFKTDLLMMAKYFERIGDHATNISERVIVSITGDHNEEMAEDRGVE